MQLHHPTTQPDLQHPHVLAVQQSGERSARFAARDDQQHARLLAVPPHLVERRPGQAQAAPECREGKQVPHRRTYAATNRPNRDDIRSRIGRFTTAAKIDRPMHSHHTAS